MSIIITRSLASRPASMSNGQVAELALGLTTTVSPTETAQITYRVGAPGVIFVSTGSPVLTTSEIVFSTGTTSRTQYALSGPPGAVPIRAEVTPSTPPARSGTQVTLKGALGFAAASARVLVRRRVSAARAADDDEPREENGRDARRKRTKRRKTARTHKTRPTPARRSRKTAPRTRSRTRRTAARKRPAAGKRSTTAKRSTSAKRPTTRKAAATRKRQTPRKRPATRKPPTTRRRRSRK